MTECPPESEVQADPVAKVARDLREILAMHAALHAEARARSADRLMPGGVAMVALGSVANMEAWENMQQATERYQRGYTSVEDEDPDVSWSAFQLLEWWSEDWRRVHDAEYRERPTIATEAEFLRWALDWAWDNEPRWDDFAADVRRARLKLEDVLYDGKRADRTRIVCDRCAAAPQLLSLKGSKEDGSEDSWKCTSCKHRFDADDVRRAHARMLRSEGAEKWVHQADAIGTLKAQGRPERTVRQWLAEGEASAYCDPVTHEVWVWWPDLWRRHLATPTRQRRGA